MSIKKDVFKMKLTGDFQLLMEYAFIHGYHDGFGRGLKEGIISDKEVQTQFEQFMEELNIHLKGNKPT